MRGKFNPRNAVEDSCMQTNISPHATVEADLEGIAFPKEILRASQGLINDRACAHSEMKRAKFVQENLKFALLDS